MAKPTSKVGFAILFWGKEMKILIVSDSKDLSQTIPLILKVRWPELSLVHATEAREAVNLIHGEQPDLVILHLNSTLVDCFDLIAQIRGFSDVPLVVFSDSNDVVDKVRALEMGADDYIAQPYMPMEFIARVNAILRRCSLYNGRPVSFLNGKLSINYATYQVHVSGKPVKLTSIEYKILCHLAKNVGSVASSADLLNNVWGPNYQADHEFLKKYIFRIRSKIEENPANPEIIRTERGVGYTLAKAL